MSLDDPIAAMLGGSSAFVYTWVCVAGWSAVNLALAIRGERGAGEPGWHADLGALRLLLCVWGIEAGAALAGLLECNLTAGPPATRQSPARGAHLEEPEITAIMLEVLTPPAVVPGSDHRRHAVYELELRNMAPFDVEVERVEVLDGDSDRVLLSLSREEILDRSWAPPTSTTPPRAAIRWRSRRSSRRPATSASCRSI